MKKNKKILAAQILLTLAISIYTNIPCAYALPYALNNSNSAEISTVNNVMTVKGKGHNNIINWANFNVNAKETVHFNGKDNYLNLVHGGDMSRIYGTLSGGNLVYLVNPNGILFGQGARLDNIGSFVASTRNISSINKSAFLQDATNVQGVLGSDNPVMDNKDYYSTMSKSLQKISVANIQLTNVPASATTVILDGPGGVVLKNKETFDKVSKIITRQGTGEIGIGSPNGNLQLSDNDKNKLLLVNGSNYYSFNDNVYHNYKQISSREEFLAQNIDFSKRKWSYYLLNNDLDFSGSNHIPIDGYGTFNGMGYNINNVTIRNSGWQAVGLFRIFAGNISNLSLNNIDYQVTDSWNVGGLAGRYYSGSINNVSINGKIEGKGNVGGIAGAFEGMDTEDNLDRIIEVRNSCNRASITIPDKENTAEVEFSDSNAGGIVATVFPALTHVGFYNTFNSGDINYRWMENDIRAVMFIGGIAGDWSKYCKMTDVYSLGNINITGPIARDLLQFTMNVGGIAGSQKGHNECILKNVYNKGSINIDIPFSRYGHTVLAGGIIGDYNYYRINATGSYLHNSITKNGIDVITELSPDEGIPDVYQKGIFTNKVGKAITPTQMNNLLNPVMFGVNNLASIGNGEYSGSPDIPSVSPDPAKEAIKDFENQVYGPVINNNSNYNPSDYHNQNITTDIIDVHHYTEAEANKEFEEVKSKNAFVIINGVKYYSSTGWALLPFVGNWNKVSEFTISKADFDLLGGLTNMIMSNSTSEPSTEPVNNALDAADLVLNSLFLPFLQGAVDVTTLQVELHKLYDNNRITIKNVDSGLSLYAGRKINLGGNSIADMMRVSRNVKKAFPELPQDKSYSVYLNVSEMCNDNPYTGFIEFDKDLNAYFTPTLPPNTSIIVESFTCDVVKDITSKYTSQKIRLDKSTSQKLLTMLAENNIKFNVDTAVSEFREPGAAKPQIPLYGNR